ncbi:MAG: O-antigen ligase family protein [Paracoccaceae bacterium]
MVYLKKMVRCAKRNLGLAFFTKNPPYQSATAFEKVEQIKNADVAAKISAISIALLPALLGFGFIQFGIVYTGSLRPVVFEAFWLLFAVSLIGASVASGTSVIEEVKLLPRTYLAVFLLFLCIWGYTSTFVAPHPVMANYYSGIGVVALLLGLAMAALRRRIGDRFLTNIAWAFFVAMLLHAPFLIWLYILEGNNPEYNWTYRLPGFPGLRMYNYSLEAGIAAGVGLFYVSKPCERFKRTLLFIGIALLWVLLFWAGGRGAFLTLNVTVILAAFLVPEFVQKMWGVLITTIILGANLSLQLFVPNKNFGILSRIDRTFNSTSLNEITSSRLTIWSDAYEIFLARPFFGHGASQYKFLTTHADLNVHEHTHNILLELLISFGVVGTIALLYPLGRVWLFALLRSRNTVSASELPMFLVATTLLVHGLLSGTFYHIHSVFMIALSMGLLLQNANTKIAAMDTSA